MSFESEFELVPLGQVASFINGDRSTNYPKGEDYVDNGIPFISAADLSDGCVQQSGVKRISTAAYERLRNGKIQDRDVLFCLRGSIGKLAYVHPNEAGAIASSLVIVRANAKIDSRYLYFILRSQAGQQAAASLNNGSAQPNLSVSELQKVAVPLPPMPIQRQIAATLDSFDDRITLLRETNATLEAIAQALFKSWFVDFDPVRAKMEGRTPEGMDEATAALFPDGFETSELGEVPRGWRVGRVDDIGEVVCGKTPPTSVAENYGEDVPFITIPDMHNLLAVTTTARSLSKLGADSQKKKYLPPGSVCVSCIATPGLVVRVTRPAQTNQQINSVIPFPKWGNAFPLFLLRRIGDTVRSNGAGGSVFYNLSKSGFEQLPVLLTSPDIARHFDAVIEPLIGKIIENQEQAQTLSTLRDTLLPRLISGQLRLPN